MIPMQEIFGENLEKMLWERQISLKAGFNSEGVYTVRKPDTWPLSLQHCDIVGLQYVNNINTYNRGLLREQTISFLRLGEVTARSSR